MAVTGSLDLHGGGGTNVVCRRCSYNLHACEYERVDKAPCFPQITFFLIINISCPNLLVIRIRFIVFSCSVVNFYKKAEFSISLWSFIPSEDRKGDLSFVTRKTLGHGEPRSEDCFNSWCAS